MMCCLSDSPGLRTIQQGNLHSEVLKKGIFIRLTSFAPVFNIYDSERAQTISVTQLAGLDIISKCT